MRILGHTLRTKRALKIEVMVVDHGSDATVITARRSLMALELERVR